VYRSSDLGFTVEYPTTGPTGFSVQAQDGHSLTLTIGNGVVTLFISGSPASQADPPTAITNQLSGLGTGLTTDSNTADALLGTPEVGYRPGSGQVNVGTLSSPQGNQGTTIATSQAATDGKVTIAVTEVLAGNIPNLPPTDMTRGLAESLGDFVNNRVQWGP
jgi:hypothetical protein